jgi:diguanylate cyclase (GGDEF)-like protein
LDAGSTLSSSRLGLLRGRATRQSLYGVGIALSAIAAALLVGSWMQAGELSITGVMHAHASNPAIWFLYLMPFVFAVMGQHMGYVVAQQVGDIVQEHTRELNERTAAAERKAAHDATHDRLTGLPNETLLRDRLNQELLRIGRSGETLALVMLGVNRFKDINDALGRDRGDQLLRQIAERLRSVVRASDTLARPGGDEFAVLAATSQEEDVEAVLRKLCAAFDAQFPLEELRIDVRAAAGVALAPRDGSDYDTLMQRADIAMDTAKEHKRDWCLYDPGMTRSGGSRSLRLLAHLRQSLRTRSLLLYYQPKVRAADHGPVSAEALVRLQHPEFGLVPPDEFIQLAEQHGLMRELSREVLRMAVEQAVAWHAAGRPLSVAVNLSTTTLLDEELPSFVEELVSGSALPPERLTFEVTESALLRDPDRALGILRRLAVHGSAISIDDFGTGYSSLAYLKKMPASELKIDKTFVFEMANSPKDAAIVRATIDLAHALGLKVVAEGVETEATARTLAALGCDWLQGYLFARPLAPEAFEAWLAERLPEEGSGSASKH